MKKRMTLLLFLYFSCMVFLRLPFWQAIDQQIAVFFIASRTPLLTKFFDVFTHLASSTTTIILALMLCSILLLLKMKRDALQLVLTLVTSAGVTALIKILVQRARPALSPLHTEASFSFPSGHTNAATTVYGFLMYLAIKYLPTKLSQIVAVAFCLVIILLIAISRLYLSVHWFTDILGGLCTAITSLYIWIEYFKTSSHFTKK